MQEDGGHVLKPVDRTERDRDGGGGGGGGKGPLLGGLRQPVFSSLVNAASVLRVSRHWQRLQRGAAEAVAQSQSDRHSCPNVCFDQVLALNIFKVIQARLVRAYLFLSGLVPFC